MRISVLLWETIDDDIEKAIRLLSSLKKTLQDRYPSQGWEIVSEEDRRDGSYLLMHFSATKASLMDVACERDRHFESTDNPLP